MVGAGSTVGSNPRHLTSWPLQRFTSLGSEPAGRSHSVSQGAMVSSARAAVDDAHKNASTAMAEKQKTAGWCMEWTIFNLRRDGDNDNGHLASQRNREHVGANN